VTAKQRLRGRFVLALPWILAFNGAWAVAEARGHLETVLGIPGGHD
jgi:hypothetical protein